MGPCFIFNLSFHHQKHIVKFSFNLKLLFCIVIRKTNGIMNKINSRFSLIKDFLTDYLSCRGNNAKMQNIRLHVQKKIAKNYQECLCKSLTTITISILGGVLESFSMMSGGGV